MKKVVLGNWKNCLAKVGKLEGSCSCSVRSWWFEVNCVMCYVWSHYPLPLHKGTNLFFTIHFTQLIFLSLFYLTLD